VREGDSERLVTRAYRDKTGARADGSAVEQLDAIQKADRAVRGAAKRAASSKAGKGARSGPRVSSRTKATAKKRQR
jgi:hypothetical protein